MQQQGMFYRSVSANAIWESSTGTSRLQCEENVEIPSESAADGMGPKREVEPSALGGAQCVVFVL